MFFCGNHPIHVLSTSIANRTVSTHLHNKLKPGVSAGNEFHVGHKRLGMCIVNQHSQSNRIDSLTQQTETRGASRGNEFMLCMKDKTAIQSDTKAFNCKPR